MNLGIIGLGTVGNGVLKILSNEKNKLEGLSSRKINVNYACDIKDIDKEYSSFVKNFTKDYNDVITSNEVDTVVELIGGEDKAKDLVLNAIRNGKNVITANKALLAKHGHEIFKLADEKDVKVLYGASVGGGIPILTPLKESLIANSINEISGILNGTANYILTEMEEKSLEFDVALDKAIKNGYAEADPTYDIEGIDTAHKISILSLLAFEEFIDFDSIKTSGITKIKKLDIELAKKWGYKIKLLANAKREDGSVTASVAPTLVSEESLLAKVNSVYNAIEVDGSYTGKTIFYGKGAGKEPTASAVVADILKSNREHSWKYDTNSLRRVKSESKGRFYVRTNKIGDFKHFEKLEERDGYFIYLTKEIELNTLKRVIDNRDSVIIKLKTEN